MYFIDYENQSLMHYGVKGMKWGVRKSVSESLAEKAHKIEANQDKYQKYMAKAQAKRQKNLSTRRAARAQRMLPKVESRALAYESKAAWRSYKGKSGRKTDRLQFKAADARNAALKTKNRAMGNSRYTRRMEGKAAKAYARQSRLARSASKKYAKAVAKGWIDSADKASINRSMKIVNQVVARDEERTKRLMKNNSPWMV